jgi:predicted nucleic acid-binding protein
MSAKFADSNVLIYLVSADERKASVAQAILADGLTISVQVLNECTNVLINKLKRPWGATTEYLMSVRSQAKIVPVDVETHERGIEIATRHRLAIYDSMIVAAALLANCDTLYSEDMHPGLVIEKRLRIVNPFALA